MPLISSDLWALRNDAGQSFPDLSVGSRRPIVDCRAWGAHALRIQLGDGTTPLTVREVADGFQFDMTARRRLTFQRRASLTFPGGEIWTPENGLTYVEFLLDDLPGVADLDGDSYVFPLSLELAIDVVLHYQPTLTQEEIDEGCIRPDWCVGSFAVYHSDGRKLGHIPRPFITDYNGTKIWGTFRRVGGVLAKVFRKTAVDALTPPLRIDATFGYDMEGASNTGQVSNRTQIVGPWAASAGTITELHSYEWNRDASNPINVQIGCYNDSSGPNTLDGSSSDISVPANTAHVNANETGLSIGISAGNHYVGTWTNPGDTDLSYYYDTDAAVTWYYQNTAQWPSPWVGSGTVASRKQSVWAVYTPSGGGPPIRHRLTPNPATGDTWQVSP